MLDILSACKARKEAEGPPLTDDNAADGKIGSAGVWFLAGWSRVISRLVTSSKVSGSDNQPLDIVGN